MPIIRIIDMTNMRYTNPEETHIDMMVLIEGEAAAHPFHYMPDADDAPVTLAIKDILDGGAEYPIEPYVPPDSPPSNRARQPEKPVLRVVTPVEYKKILSPLIAGSSIYPPPTPPVPLVINPLAKSET